MDKDTFQNITAEAIQFCPACGGSEFFILKEPVDKFNIRGLICAKDGCGEALTFEAYTPEEAKLTRFRAMGMATINN